MGKRLKARIRQDRKFGREKLVDFSPLPSHISASARRTSSAAKTRGSSSSPTGRPNTVSSFRRSKQLSEELSDIAPEIVVWTEDMEMDIDGHSQDEPDGPTISSVDAT
jgi:hypothetical protein